MIVSHEHRFIFLKTRKTAGTSVEIALSQYCGTRDIVTPIGPDDEILRAEAGGIGPQNYDLPFRMYSPRNMARLVLTGRKSFAYNHMPAREVRSLVGKDIFNAYRKFSIVRNPWDMVVSWYFWKFRQERPPLLDVLKSDALKPLLASSSVYSIDGTIAVDHICRFESLEADLSGVWQSVGIEGPPNLPHAKGGSRPDRLHYREVLDSKEASEVERLFAWEIERFGYEF